MVRNFMTASDTFGLPDLPPEIKTYYYAQTLDHFNYNPESYKTFQQKYFVNSKYWGGSNSTSNSPIFVYMGDEANITLVASFDGFINEIASNFNGLIVYIEHRYYGDSMPFGIETFNNASTLGFFSSTQALADYAQLITDLKRNLTAENCPVIAVGGSYGGMLASWFRLKYPHIVDGALASSAPILYFDDITPQNAYLVIVTKDYRDVSENCYNTIRDSWFEIDRVAANSNGLLNLSRIFNTCYPLTSSKELKDNLMLQYVFFAQYDNPPSYWVEKICKGIDGAGEGTYILDKIAAGFHSILGSNCAYIYDLKVSNKSGWGWQDIKSVLGNFASNIIFSNGGRDPYSGGGVLQNISDSVVALYAEKGAHGSDLGVPMASDPSWLVSLRAAEKKIIQGWIAQYNATHHAT
ncbi:hypothetical protein LguiB_031442 [Lonicera macranthoides]